MGVVAIISPWNFPVQLSLIPLISAVIAGNAVILKPSENTPRINQIIENLLNRCGFPHNLIQVVHGAGDVGEQLIDARPDKVFFTGGSFVGQKVYERAARCMIPCDLELGGNDAMIVCRDANLERAARAAVWGGFLHSGQVCISVERVYVEAPLYEAFVERVVELTGQLRQGLSTEHDLGGMTTTTGFQKVRAALKEAVEMGAKIRIGANPDHLTEPFFPPTVVTDVNEQMSIINEETFGPVLCVVPVRDEQEAVERTNASRYGLNSYIFSRDLKKAQTIAAALETGNCYINDVITNIGNMHLPFGGVKASGIGRYHGAEGLYTFCHTKSVMVDKGKTANKFSWFPYNERRFQMFRKLLNWLYGR
jgi:acyl-CoA reductase-like NAD-dependent aldehyde dehydrogenase